MASKSLTRKKIKTEDETVCKTKSVKRNRSKEVPTTSKKLKVEIKSEEEEPVEFKKIKPEPGPSTFNLKPKLEHFWDDHELLAETHNLQMNVAQNLIKLFDEGNTIPFIARYRKDATGNLTPEELRGIKEEYDNINALKARSETVLKNIAKTGNLNPSIQKAVLSAHTLEELEYIYAPYKPGTKRGLAERAKALGLEKPALDLLNNCDFVDPNNYVNPSNKELKSAAEVEKGLMHIIASVIATDTQVLSFMRKLRSETTFMIVTKKLKAKKESTTKMKTTKKQETNKNVNEDKFSIYFDFKISHKYIKPHQILAINRGEAFKVLSVKIEVPDFINNKFFYFCSSQWINVGKYNPNRKRILEMAIKDSFTRLVQPLVIREVRAGLKNKAEKASYEVFSTNLKQLLLMPPVKGKPILGIDPGFTNGCKLGLISETGSVLATDIIYPHKNKGPRDDDVVKNLLNKFNCHLVAVGNGTACRETESWLSDLIQRNALDVTYTIVNEAGASIYSCSNEAKKEFPLLDPNLISAVSLARRVQEPLAELVKVEPKHLGVGMYQHDLPKKQLELALDEVVTECVSFVGVDLNTASQSLLRRVAGLTDNRASKIVEYREKHGQFFSREELLKIKGIGAKVFQQCAGFLRVGPTSIEQAEHFYKKSSTEKLDCTYIHPESYSIAKKLIKELKVNYNEVGQKDFCDALKSKMTSLNKTTLSASLDTPVETINLILDALSKPLNFDLRSECSQVPLFKKGLTSIDDLQAGSVLTGSVSNATHFGCFIDIGVGINGLVHGSKMNGFNLQIGDRVEVKVLSVEIARNRIGLQMVNKLN